MAAAHDPQQLLEDDDRVRWAQQQRIKSRQKRDFLSFPPSRMAAYPSLMGKNRVSTNDPKWPQMWYLVRFRIIQ